MSKKSCKKNKNHRNPPLTFLDKSIYFFCIILSFLICIILVYCFEYIRYLIAFNNPYTVAYTSSAGSLFSLPYLLYIEISAMIFFISGWQGKKPLFGSKKIKYGEYPWREDCFPLLRSNKYISKSSPSKKRFTRQMTALWCVGSIIFMSFIPLSLFGRNIMNKDNSIEQINIFNNTTDIYKTEDFSQLTISAKYVSEYRGSDYWTYEISIEMKDGKNFTFSNRDFDKKASDATDITLDKMLEIKELFSKNEITIKGAENIQRVSEFMKMSSAQTEKLILLFNGLKT